MSRWCSYEARNSSTISDVEGSVAQLIRDVEWELAADGLEDRDRRRLDELTEMLEWWKGASSPTQANW